MRFVRRLSEGFNVDEVSASAGLRFLDGLWIGVLPSRYGTMEIVLDVTPQSPKQEHLVAIQAFKPRAEELGVGGA
jgi:hypothetical protein